MATGMECEQPRVSRLVFGILGAVLALAPERVLAWYKRVAMTNPEVPTAKAWLRPGIRAEGVVYALVSLRGGRGYDWLVNVAGLVGAVAAVAPEQYLDWGGSLAFYQAELIEWRAEFVSAVRALGLAFVVLALARRRSRRQE